MKFTFTRVARHRVFQHDPIYYDEQKERREERERRIREELGMLTEEEKDSGYAQRIKGGMRRRMKSHYEVSRSAKRKSNIRLVIILVILMIIGYYIVESDMDWLKLFLGE
nr:hypothetical protein [uncultured Carboxylicivirga sp.]